jgi:hypothetical protein
MLAAALNSPGGFMADNTVTGSYQIMLPQDLVQEAARQSKRVKEQLHVEGWRSSWASRISELFVGKE